MRIKNPDDVKHLGPHARKQIEKEMRRTLKNKKHTLPLAEQTKNLQSQ
jgi:hypothetical protein